MSTTTTKLCRNCNKIMVYIETVTIIYCDRLTKKQFTRKRKKRRKKENNGLHGLLSGAGPGHEDFRPAFQI